MDKPEYDRPDDDETTGSRALIFLGLAVVVIVIFYAMFNSDVLG